MSIRSKRRFLTAVLGAVAVSATLLTPPVAAAAPFKPPPLQRLTPVDVRDVGQASRAEKSEPVTPPAAALPAPGVTEVDPTAKAARGGPVSVAARDSRRVRVEVLDQAAAAKAGRPGVLMRLGRADKRTQSRAAAEADPVAVSLDYTAFAGAYGGGWGQRLRLLRLPECALTTPQSAQCQPVELAARNDSHNRTLSAEVDLSANALLAATAGPSGSAGTYKASDLAPSATWQSGGSTGGFTWAYPMATPPTPGGLAPPVSLAYSSSSVDGKTVSTNSQASPVGEGFAYSPGYIERRYKACADDMGAGANNTAATGDQCWETDNATMSLNGSGAELIKDANGRWHGRTDDGSRIERLTGAANGDNDGEHWKVTTTDGTQYFFGRDQLPGHTAGKPLTNSAWTLPVAGNDSGEPCRQTTFAASFCAQVWRWNLDHVIDRSGNVIVYYYQKDTNRYARNLDGTNAVDYVRGGAVDRIEYGLRAGSEYTVAAPARVRFTTAERCFVAGGCDPAVQANHKNWLDTPMDQLCTGSTCPGRVSPTFFTSKRLASVATQIRSGTGYVDVDSWTLAHSFKDPKDTTSQVLWLDSITRTGHVGGTVTMPPVRFEGAAMNNRADGLEGTPSMNRFRLTNIHTETGGEIGVAYSERDCVPGTRMPAGEDNNTLRCMPVRWQPDGFAAPTLDWFHTYVVTSVSEFDRTGGAPRVITSYEYQGTPAWHGDDDDGLVAAKNKTWAQYRGYGAVKTTKGDVGQQPMITLTRYFRGMHGDKLKAGGTRSVQVDGINDDDAFAGAVRESIAFDGANEVSGTVNDPWQSSPTASRTINGTTVHARFTGTAKQVTRTKLDGGRPDRVTTVTNRHDTYGMIDQVNDLGVAASGDEKCTTSTFARNTDDWLVSSAITTEAYALSCGTAPTSQDAVISLVRNHYDNTGHGTAPTKGRLTKAEKIATWSATGAHTFAPTASTEFDDYGRIITSTDAAGVVVARNTFNHNAAGLLSATTTKNALSHITSSTVDPARASVLSETDANGHRTDLAYDPLGRLSGVWRPGRVKGTDTPNHAFEYSMTATTPTVITTKSINQAGVQVASYELLDALLRPRQTQGPSPLGGRILSDTFYDSAGRSILGYDKYYATGNPGGTLVTAVNPAQIERQTATRYDGAGRVVASVFQPKNTEKWRTSRTYGGDRVSVTPPQGGTATTTITDADGKTVELRQHHSTGYDSTTYVHDRRGDLRAVVDPLGNRWEYELDLRGRVVKTKDPDQGTSTTEYDDLDRRIGHTDARGTKLVTTYDDLSRKTGLYEGSKTGVKRASWTWDTAPNGKGLAASATRHVGTAAYRTTIAGYTPIGNSLGSTVDIPSTEGNLGGLYEFGATYHLDGSVQSQSVPELAGAWSETLSYTYNVLGGPVTMTSDLPDTPSYVTDTTYNEYGDLLQAKLSSGNGTVYRAFTYETDTGRTATATTLRDRVSPNTVNSTSYGYDNAGNLLRVADTATGDTQCFEQDYLRRTTHAWTPGNGNCATTNRTVAALGGPAPYWHSWTFDAIGNRKTETRHAAAGDTVATLDYAGTRPHAVTKMTTTAPGAPAKTDTYDYDAIGNTKTRNLQTIEWDAEGRAAKVKEGTKESTYLYDADGNRLIARDSTGTTLYLPNGVELKVDKNGGNLACTRYYTFGKLPVAMRSGGTLSWLITDHHDTASTVIADGTQTIKARYSLPYGGSRGAAPSNWPGTKGFVGGTNDDTGLTHLGAREFDQAIGKFLSVDPVIDNGDPQQLNGYAYGNNNPGTYTDPDGLWSFKGFMKGVYKNAGTISAIAGVAALGFGWVPFVGQALIVTSLVFGLIDTYKSCSEGQKLDCAMGFAGFVPGVRGAYKGYKGAKAARAAIKQADDDVVDAAAKNKAAQARHADPSTGNNARKQANKASTELADRQAKAAQVKAERYDQRWGLQVEDTTRGAAAWDAGDKVLTAENAGFEYYKHNFMNHEADRHNLYLGQKVPPGSKNFKWLFNPPKPATPAKPAPQPGDPTFMGPVANRPSGITPSMVEQKMSYMEKKYGM
ncbi:FIG01288243: hypothetical protein [Alloactinosynnema sp. L-07]|uniref:RHS repeat-associated core domain-containing protein n=1 Tax=Alloactinosynnema sp. L-07 TaxID=1653480 RepID=UPI00065EF873|nr:RHS repeat-associated core domain-containing protein [Alloactinosynnema sp. L-07]CRK57924.1 FIG01288243: hypothetical protein [Alloactinosynnema sp. L-07]